MCTFICNLKDLRSVIMKVSSKITYVTDCENDPTFPVIGACLDSQTLML